MINPEQRARFMEEESITAKEKLPNKDQMLERLSKSGNEKMTHAYAAVCEIAERAKTKGGKALIVGGFVRDFVMGSLSKDIDTEIFGIPQDQIPELIQGIGKSKEVGKTFGITKIDIGGIDIDLSMPREDSKTNEGHRGFEIAIDPNMSVLEAARRRDFTMNSLSADPLTGRIYDPFNGLADIGSRILRVTDSRKFGEDPLRALRALQFMGRFRMNLEPKSAEIVSSMTPFLRELSPSKLLEEWKKILLKSEVPSIAVSAGVSLGLFKELHPQISSLAEIPQDPIFHPEGNVLNHTLGVLDICSRLVKENNMNEESALTIMLTGLCHDFGKITHTQIAESKITSRGHEEAGVEPAREFMTQISIKKETQDKVLKLVANHLKPTLFYVDENYRNQKISKGAINKLADRLHPATIHELVLVAEADHLGRGPFENAEETLIPHDNYLPGNWLLEKAREAGVEKSKPVDLLLGRDLVAVGYKPGKHFGKITGLANELRDLGFSKDDVLKAISGMQDDETGNRAIEKLRQMASEK